MGTGVSLVSERPCLVPERPRRRLEHLARIDGLRGFLSTGDLPTPGRNAEGRERRQRPLGSAPRGMRAAKVATFLGASFWVEGTATPFYVGSVATTRFEKASKGPTVT